MRKTKKLKLNKQSIRVLSDGALQGAAGGQPRTGPPSAYCPSSPEVCGVTTIWPYPTEGCP